MRQFQITLRDCNGQIALQCEDAIQLMIAPLDRLWCCITAAHGILPDEFPADELFIVIERKDADVIYSPLAYYEIETHC
jgi:hypothetical protein